MKTCVVCHEDKEDAQFYFRQDDLRPRRECKECYLRKDRKKHVKPRPCEHGFNGWKGLSIAVIFSAFKDLDHEKEEERVIARHFLERDRGPWCLVMGVEEDFIDKLLEKYDGGDEIAKSLPQPSAVMTRVGKGTVVL